MYPSNGFYCERVVTDYLYNTTLFRTLRWYTNRTIWIEKRVTFIFLVGVGMSKVYQKNVIRSQFLLSFRPRGSVYFVHWRIGSGKNWKYQESHSIFGPCSCFQAQILVAYTINGKILFISLWLSLLFSRDLKILKHEEDFYISKT